MTMTPSSRRALLAWPAAALAALASSSQAQALDLGFGLGLPKLDPEHDRVMLCGSPGLLKDMKVILEKKGYKEGSTTSPGDFVVERAFVEQ